MTHETRAYIRGYARALECYVRALEHEFTNPIELASASSNMRRGWSGVMEYDFNDMRKAGVSEDTLRILAPHFSGTLL